MSENNLNSNQTFLLYKFSENKHTEMALGYATYKIVQLFNDLGKVKSAQIKQILNDFDVQDFENIQFKTKERLLQFAQALGDYLNNESIYLLSVNDFNIGIESCHDTQSFKQIFNRYGTELECDGKSSKSSGIFGKFF